MPRIQNIRNKWKIFDDNESLLKSFFNEKEAKKYFASLTQDEQHLTLNLDDLAESADASKTKEIADFYEEEEGFETEESGSEWLQQAEEDSEASEEEPHSSSQSWIES